MRMVIQRVSEASVTVEGNCVGKIGNGFLVLLGAEDADTEDIADKMTAKLVNMRIFMDENGKTNLSLADVGGELLIISQFTLYADCRRGNRPSFVHAGSPEHAERIYEYVLAKCKESIPVVEKGVFGAKMDVALVNDGPFTVILDSDEIVKK